jgi:hypothetical protein
MRPTIPDLAVAALVLWALLAVSEQPRQQQRQPAPRPAAVAPEPQRWQHPDPRTIAQFPGP